MSAARKKKNRGRWSDAEAKAVASLAGDFDVTAPAQSRVSIGITCKSCGRAWALLRKDSGRVHGGNVLRLLEHAAEHKNGGAP